MCTQISGKNDVELKKLYEKIYKLHNITHITINDLSLRDVYIRKDENEITNEEL